MFDKLYESVNKDVQEGKNPDWNKDKEEVQIKKLNEDIDEDDLARFEEIREEIGDLVDEAFKLIPKGIVKDRAKDYWYGQIFSALGSNGYERGSMHSMADSLKELTKMGTKDESDIKKSKK
jgi:hypothetical protein